jgi:hypothetical protein
MFLITRIILVATLAVFAVLVLYWFWTGAPWFFVGMVMMFGLHVAAYRALVAGRQAPPRQATNNSLSASDYGASLGHSSAILLSPVEMPFDAFQGNGVCE